MGKTTSAFGGVAFAPPGLPVRDMQRAAAGANDQLVMQVMARLQVGRKYNLVQGMPAYIWPHLKDLLPDIGLLPFFKRHPDVFAVEMQPGSTKKMAGFVTKVAPQPLPPTPPQSGLASAFGDGGLASAFGDGGGGNTKRLPPVQPVRAGGRGFREPRVATWPATSTTNASADPRIARWPATSTTNASSVSTGTCHCMVSGGRQEVSGIPGAKPHGAHH